MSPRPALRTARPHPSPLRAAVRLAAALPLLAGPFGCGEAPNGRGAAPAPPPSAGAPAAPARVVDSILPMPELLRRFRARLGPAPAALAGGAATREALVRGFVRAVEARDTAALRRMALSRAEFAYLYFPESPLARRPYEVPPALLWFQIAGGSNKGAGRALGRLGGRPMGYAGHRCEASPARQGPNRLWERCAVRLARPASGRVAGGAPADTAAVRLFGSIVERGGRFKFVSYANDF